MIASVAILVLRYCKVFLNVYADDHGIISKSKELIKKIMNYIILGLG